MKHVFIITAILTLGLSSASHAALRLGGKFGVNFSNVEATQTDNIDYKTRTGFGVGPMLAIDGAGSPLALRMEMLFVQKGAKFSDPAGDGTLKNDEVVFAPFLLFKLIPSGAAPYLEVGPEVGFNTLAEANMPDARQSITDQWKKQNFSLNFGAGILIPAGGSALELDARYNLGLMNLSDNVQGNGEIKTNGVQIFAGFYFLGF